MKLSTPIEKLLFTTIRIETRLPDGSFVDGTAFVFEYSTSDNTYPFLITAKHLINDALEGRITLYQGQNRSPIIGKGYTLDIDNFSKLWFCHPDDNANVAVTPFVPFVKHVENSGVSICFQALNDACVYDYENSDVSLVSNDVVYLGYPKHCWDKKHLLPVFRSGILSLPFDLDYQGNRQAIVDTQVIQGSSGSPVFIKSDQLKNSTENMLLGVLTNLSEVIENDTDEKETLSDNPLYESNMGQIIRMDVAIEAIVAYLQEKGFL